MNSPPPCKALGRQCRSLRVTLRVGDLADGPGLDHEATWLLGHTEAITFGRPRRVKGDLLVEAELRVPCRYLGPGPGGGSACRAHGFHGPVVRGAAAGEAQPRRLARDRFRVVDRHRQADLALLPPRRSLPGPEWHQSLRGGALSDRGQHPARGMLPGSADRDPLPARRGPAGASDPVPAEPLPLQDRADGPTVDRGGGHLRLWLPGRTDGVSCGLHGRLRPDGRTAKPDLCSEWPDDGKGEHPGCIFGGPEGPAAGPGQGRSR